jgi:soluble lytic murein transglycosylase-like protein
MTETRVNSPSRGLLVGHRVVSRSLAALLAVVSLAPITAAANPRHVKPSGSALSRLEQYEPYITYFTSLRYGELQHSISSDYIRALILTESAAQKFAVSNKGARGLTQIMPETGRLAVRNILAEGVDYRYVEEEKLVRYNADMLYDPSVNILIACYLGARYHADYSGRSDLSAAAWNAGPEAVARYGNRIPNYRETRGMVARVVGYLNYFNAYPMTGSASEPAQVGPTASAGPVGSAGWSDSNHDRWDTNGWNDPGWDEKKVNWAMPY